MYDFNQLPNNGASHPFSQPLRSDEFNINLAHLEVRLSAKDVRGVLSLHTGTSVKATYAAETNNRELSQIIHEAWAGYQVAEGFWIDAGIYPAPYTWETWLSKENKTYSHSMVTEFVPFYQTGIRGYWQPIETFNASLNLINGWQNISENNNGKAIGLSLAFNPLPYVSFAYNNFIGNEQPSGMPVEMLYFNDICLRLGNDGKFQVDMTYDFGTQKVDSVNRVWMGAALVAKIPFGEKFAFGLRGEYYKDEFQVIYKTGTDKGFDGFGASINFDFQLSKNLVWRTEGRMLQATTPLFASKRGNSKRSGFTVSSFALSF